MSIHEASPNRWLLKPASHIQATCHLDIARVLFKKARPECALHYHTYQLPDNLYISLEITSIKGTSQCFKIKCSSFTLQQRVCAIPCNFQHSVLDSHLLTLISNLKYKIYFACNSQSRVESRPMNENPGQIVEDYKEYRWEYRIIKEMNFDVLFLNWSRMKFVFSGFSLILYLILVILYLELEIPSGLVRIHPLSVCDYALPLLHQQNCRKNYCPSSTKSWICYCSPPPWYFTCVFW